MNTCGFLTFAEEEMVAVLSSYCPVSTAFKFIKGGYWLKQSWILDYFNLILMNVILCFIIDFSKEWIVVFWCYIYKPMKWTESFNLHMLEHCKCEAQPLSICWMCRSLCCAVWDVGIDSWRFLSNVDWVGLPLTYQQNWSRSDRGFD